MEVAVEKMQVELEEEMDVDVYPAAAPELALEPPALLCGAVLLSRTATQLAFLPGRVKVQGLAKLEGPFPEENLELLM